MDGVANQNKDPNTYIHLFVFHVSWEACWRLVLYVNFEISVYYTYVHFIFYQLLLTKF